MSHGVLLSQPAALRLARARDENPSVVVAECEPGKGGCGGPLLLGPGAFTAHKGIVACIDAPGGCAMVWRFTYSLAHDDAMARMHRITLQPKDS